MTCPPVFGLVSEILELREMVRAAPVRVDAGPERGAVVDKHPAVGGKLRVERDGEQAPLVIGRVDLDHPVPDIQERLVDDGAVHEEDLHVPGLVDQEEPSAAVLRIRDSDGSGEPAGDKFEADGTAGVCSFVSEG